MAGLLPDFDPDSFRDAIRFAMNMGAPPTETDQATFYFPRGSVGGPRDASGVPFSPDTSVTFTTVKPPVKVPCAIEDASGSSTQTGLGSYGDAVVVTLLDEDYETVRGFEFVAVAGVRYDYQRELPPAGLGPVGVHRLLCTGEGQR